MCESSINGFGDEKEANLQTMEERLKLIQQKQKEQMQEIEEKRTETQEKALEAMKEETLKAKQFYYLNYPFKA